MNEISSIIVRPLLSTEVEEYVLDLAFPLFEKRFPHMNRNQVRAWAEIATQSPFYCCVRTEKAVGIALVSKDLFEPLPQARELFVAAAPDASPFEAMAIYRAMLEWAREKKCMPFTFGGENIGAIAKRLNAKIWSTTYRVEV